MTDPDPDLEALAAELANLSTALRASSLAAGRAAAAVYRRRHTDDVLLADVGVQLELDLDEAAGKSQGTRGESDIQAPTTPASAPDEANEGETA